MPSRLSKAALLAVLALSAVRVVAQNCNGTLGTVNVSPSCGTLASPCPLSGTTFTLYDVNTGLPYVLTPYDTGVTWVFGDGLTTETGVSVQHTWRAAGNLNAKAVLASTIYDSGPR